MGDSCLAGNLFELLAEVPDPRSRHGRRHPLGAMLATIVCAILTGARGYRAIAHWVRSQDVIVWHRLGFHRKPPCANTFRNLLLALNPEVLEAILRQWMAAIVQLPASDAIRSVAMDGKTLCNTLAAHERNVHLLSLLDQATGGVLSQQQVPPTTNEAKTAADLLKTIILKGRLVTGDAMFCQRALCEEIVDSGGDYLFVVKDNQPELKAAVAADFQPGFSPQGDCAMMGNLVCLGDCDFRCLLKSGKSVEVAEVWKPIPCRRRSRPTFNSTSPLLPIRVAAR